jgi:uncharacterized protein (DUF2225 family)
MILLKRIKQLFFGGAPMGSIFDGLEAFGLEGLKGMSLEEKKSEEEKKAKEKEQLNLLDYIFEKNFDCRVCGKPFKAHTVKSKVKLEGIDEDLMPTYSPIDPILYDVLICPHCGYSALRSTFSSINERQSEYILETITPKFKHKPHPAIMDLDTAIADYKLALINCLVKKGKSNEKGFICMKISWLYKKKGDAENELLFVKQAYESFTEAFSRESFPFCGLDENTVSYIMARFSMKLGLYDDAMRLISRLIVSPGLTPRLKERTLDMKEMLKKL